MSGMCLTRKERHWCVGLSLVTSTLVVCSVLVYASLKYTEYDYRNRSIQSGKLADEECIPTCFTEGCVLHANLLNKNMEPSFDQCEDFYSFSCAKFENQFGKDDNSSNYEVFTDRIFMELKDLLDNLVADPESASGKMKMVYDSCMDTRSSELNAVSSILKFFGVPNWPDLSPDFEFIEPKLSTMLGTWAAYGVNIFKIKNRMVNGKPMHDAEVAIDLFKKTDVDIPKMNERTLRYFNLDEKDVMESVFRYFHRFAALKSRSEICKIKGNNEFYLNCSQEVPQQWRILCEIIDAFVDVGNVSHMISKTDVYIPCHEVEAVEMILNLTTEIPHKVLVDMLMLKLFVNHLDDLNFYFRLIRKDDTIPERNPDVDRRKLNHWEHCVQWATKHMILPLGREYIENILTEQVVIEVHDIIEECCQEINDLIISQKWFTNAEKTHILSKLDKPVSTEVLLKYYLNETYVNNYYSEFHPTPGSFIKNVLEYERMLFSAKMRREYSLVAENTPFIMNAFNGDNLIEIGFGFLKFPGFIRHQPRILNLIRMAVSLGHELGHVIDDCMEEFLRNDSSAVVKIIERTSCINDQFSNFRIKSLGVKVPAYQTANENHADSVSLALIDKLIKKYATEEVTYSLPSLPYSTKELFYMIYAELACEKNSKERDLFKYEFDSHAQEIFRVTAVMQNSKSFSKTFNCTEGSYMNPEHKCSLLDLE